MNQPKQASETQESKTFRKLYNFLFSKKTGAELRERIMVKGRRLGVTIQFRKTGLDEHGTLKVILSNGQAWDVTSDNVEAKFVTISVGEKLISLDEVMAALGIETAPKQNGKIEETQGGIKGWLRKIGL
jgi:hypothetical protein